jgi:hypothetical protein
VPVSLYRVFSHLERAAKDEPGGALFVPTQGRGRIDNPSHYVAYYTTMQPEAAVAEVLGAREAGPIRSDSFRGTPLLEGSALALATLEITGLEAICDLDDPKELVSRGLRPSRVITRDYRVSQAWALDVFRESGRRERIGVSWWSYYESQWTSVAIWKRQRLRLRNIEPLNIGHAAVLAAAKVLRRRITT